MTLVFTSGPEAHIWRIPVAANATPVPVTDSAGGCAARYLSDGRIAFWRGSVGGDPDMHIMVASAATVAGVPAPAILQRFNGRDVGLAPNASRPPAMLSIAGDGRRAVGGGAAAGHIYLLDWTSGNLEARPLEVGNLGQVNQAAISRDGTRIALATATGTIAHAPFSGGAPTVLGAGECPSYNQDGTRLGHLDETGGQYVLHNLAAGTSQRFTLPVPVYDPVLSWDGRQIAFRTAPDHGGELAVATLSE
jgi:hypothetical protein